MIKEYWQKVMSSVIRIHLYCLHIGMAYKCLMSLPSKDLLVKEPPLSLKVLGNTKNLTTEPLDLTNLPFQRGSKTYNKEDFMT